MFFRKSWHPISLCLLIHVAFNVDLKTLSLIHITFTLFQLHCSSFCLSLGYQISYRLDSRDPLHWTTVEVGSNGRQFTVTGLSPEQTYVFRLIARTVVGWGEEQEALVVTTERRGKGHRTAFAVVSVSVVTSMITTRNKNIRFWMNLSCSQLFERKF